MSDIKNQFERVKGQFYYPDKEEVFSLIGRYSMTAAGAINLIDACAILNRVIENENNEFSDEDIEIAKEINHRITNYYNSDSSTK